MDTASADLDFLCLVPRGVPISELPDVVIRPAVRRQLAAMRAAMLGEGCVCNLRALHFQPPSWPHPVTVVYPLHASAGKVSPPSFALRHHSNDEILLVGVAGRACKSRRNLYLNTWFTALFSLQTRCWKKVTDALVKCGHSSARV